MDTEQLYTLFNTPARIKALQHFISDKKKGTYKALPQHYFFPLCYRLINILY